jgi:hypothetical protein
MELSINMDKIIGSKCTILLSLEALLLLPKHKVSKATPPYVTNIKEKNKIQKTDSLLNTENSFQESLHKGH